MARNAKKTTNTESTSVCIIGTLDSVFEGKNANYLDVKVSKGGKYYDMFHVDAPKEIALPDDGETVTITGTLTTFFDRDKKYQKVIINAKSVTDTNGNNFE